MKKLLITITSLVLTLLMCFSATGCGLITTDTERDMNQVVATVQIDESAPVEKIYKKDMVTAYLNSNYYSQLLGYGSVSYSAIIDSLVQNRVYLQNAMKSLSDKDSTITDKWNVESYLTEEEITDAKYSSTLSLNNIIESYVTHDHSSDGEKNDSLWETVRTTPTNATNYVAEKTKEEKEEYNKYIIGFDKDVTAENRNAYNKVVNALKENGLLGDDYKGDLRDSDFFKQTLKSNYENTLITKYEKSIKDEVRATYTFDKLNLAYQTKYDEQKAWSDTDFAEKLSAASASEPLLYGHGGKYGYVYNLLLGVDGTVLSDKISEIDKAASKQQQIEERRAILEATTVKDLRSTWLLSGYDFDTTTNKFTGDYTFAKDAKNSLAFQGEVEKLRDKNEEEGLTAKYRVNSVKEFSLSEFVKFMEEYVYGAEVSADTGVTNASIYKKHTSTAIVEEYDAKINELLFAFSTDPGSLNAYKGYAVKPIPEGADTEEYEQEFADGARILLEMGGTSYVMAATNYGYHVMFFSEVFNANYNFATLKDYLDYEYGAKNWEAELATILEKWDETEEIKAYKNNYLYLLLDSVSSTVVDNAITEYRNETLNKYKLDSDQYVKIYESRFADLT